MKYYSQFRFKKGTSEHLHMALVMEEPKIETKKKITIITPKEGRPFVWDYPSQKHVQIDPDKLMGISMFNKDLDKITNKDQILYPENKDSETETEAKNNADNFRDSDVNPADDERSIIIEIRGSGRWASVARSAGWGGCSGSTPQG